MSASKQIEDIEKVVQKAEVQIISAIVDQFEVEMLLTRTMLIGKRKVFACSLALLLFLALSGYPREADGAVLNDSLNGIQDTLTNVNAEALEGVQNVVEMAVGFLNITCQQLSRTPFVIVMVPQELCQVLANLNTSRALSQLVRRIAPSEEDRSALTERLNEIPNYFMVLKEDLESFAEDYVSIGWELYLNTVCVLLRMVKEYSYINFELPILCERLTNLKSVGSQGITGRILPKNPRDAIVKVLQAVGDSIGYVFKFYITLCRDIPPDLEGRDQAEREFVQMCRMLISLDRSRSQLKNSHNRSQN